MNDPRKFEIVVWHPEGGNHIVSYDQALNMRRFPTLTPRECREWGIDYSEAGIKNHLRHGMYEDWDEDDF